MSSIYQITLTTQTDRTVKRDGRLAETEATTLIDQAAKYKNGYELLALNSFPFSLVMLLLVDA